MHASALSGGGDAHPPGDLAYLALKAAIQLNRSLKGKSADHEPIQALVRAITRSPGEGSTLDRSHIATNAKALSLLGGALREVRKERMRTRDILSTIAEFVQGLESPDPDVRHGFEEQMRDFCLALHGRLLAEKFPIKDADSPFGGGFRTLGLR